jgi:hypothetical protein
MEFLGKIKTMPVWKLALIVFLSVSFLVVGVEHYFISKAFGFMEFIMDAMNQGFIEDEKGWEKTHADMDALDKSWKDSMRRIDESQKHSTNGKSL